MSAPRLALSLLATALAVGCAAAPLNKPLEVGKVDAGPGTITQAREYLQGHWTLVSFELYLPNQQPVHAAASGTMDYDDFANMNVELKLTPEATRVAEQIGIPAPNGTITTTGRTVINMGNRSLSYVLEGQEAVRPPRHALDTNRPRYWEVMGNTLTLRTKDENGTVLSVSVWQKG